MALLATMLAIALMTHHRGGLHLLERAGLSFGRQSRQRDSRRLSGAFRGQRGARIDRAGHSRAQQAQRARAQLGSGVDSATGKAAFRFVRQRMGDSVSADAGQWRDCRAFGGRRGAQVQHQQLSQSQPDRGPPPTPAYRHAVGRSSPVAQIGIGDTRPTQPPHRSTQRLAITQFTNLVESRPGPGD